jgi:hypothetical protein
MCDFLKLLGASTSWSLRGLSRPVMVQVSILLLPHLERGKFWLQSRLLPQRSNSAFWYTSSYNPPNTPQPQTYILILLHGVELGIRNEAAADQCHVPCAVEAKPWAGAYIILLHTSCTERHAVTVGALPPAVSLVHRPTQQNMPHKIIMALPGPCNTGCIHHTSYPVWHNFTYCNTSYKNTFHNPPTLTI